MSSPFGIPPPTEPLVGPGLISDIWYKWLQKTDDNVASSDARTLTTGQQTLYVRKDGSDSNDGLANNATHAFLTIGHALDYAAKHLDCPGGLTIMVAAGTYAESITLPNIVGGQGNGVCSLVGDTTTPANVIIDSSALVGSATVFRLGEGPEWSVKGFKLKASSSDPCVWAHAGGWIRCWNLEFNSGGYHALADHRGTVELQANCTLSASPGQGIGFISNYAGYILGVSGVTITLTGTPNYATTFVYASNLTLQAWFVTFSGAATGQRFLGLLNSVFQTNGAGVNYFPGNSAGGVATGAQYA